MMAAGVPVAVKFIFQKQLHGFPGFRLGSDKDFLPRRSQIIHQPSSHAPGNYRFAVVQRGQYPVVGMFGVVVMTRTHHREIYVFNSERCDSCGLCIAICRFEAISF
jgi:ferredoxin